MVSARASLRRPAVIGWSRWILVLLAAVFALGAFGQFFLAGLSMFDDAARWNDHVDLGNTIGWASRLMWIPAALGRTGRSLIIATVLMLVLFELQYAFINADSGVANAFHPLNGSILLVLSCWIAWRSFEKARQPLPAVERAPGRAVEGAST